jgi:polyisoprenoid-binding protein YceI
VGFGVKHLGITTVRGEFAEFDGTLEVDDSGIRVHGTVNAASVDTGEPQRDDHLRSADFFHVEEHPHIEFRSNRVEPIDEETYRVVGDLTLHRRHERDRADGGAPGRRIGPLGNDRVGLEVTGQLSRGEYGMTFNQALGSGNVLVSDKVKLALDISAVKQA